LAGVFVSALIIIVLWPRGHTNSLVGNLVFWGAVSVFAATFGLQLATTETISRIGTAGPSFRIYRHRLIFAGAVSNVLATFFGYMAAYIVSKVLTTTPATTICTAIAVGFGTYAVSFSWALRRLVNCLR
jgi:hypothetical protein